MDVHFSTINWQKYLLISDDVIIQQEDWNTAPRIDHHHHHGSSVVDICSSLDRGVVRGCALWQITMFLHRRTVVIRTGIIFIFLLLHLCHAHAKKGKLFNKINLDLKTHLSPNWSVAPLANITLNNSESQDTNDAVPTSFWFWPTTWAITTCPGTTPECRPPTSSTLPRQVSSWSRTMSSQSALPAELPCLRGDILTGEQRGGKK